ncbi:partner and localizer of BRCA2 isoform X3 [Pithys albifrons albifrons]|uniref:partner and localizer of BRCA2 isoform X3 n=1 Tax=Pithys albifrons albifrons TaxID=3385563 RepID=UPI003A5CFD10
MEGARALSGAQREKLREKLALLRREYSETVTRLRRARRAERARSHGRRERSPPGAGWSPPGAGWSPPGAGWTDRRPPGMGWSPPGSKDNASPSADRGAPTQLQVKTCSDVDTEKATSVTCKHIPEFCSGEVCLQDSSQAESVQASQENLCPEVIRPVPEEKTPQTSRGMKKLRRQTKALESKQRKSGHDGHVMSTDETVKNQIASAKELQSPVFRHSTLSHTEERAERASVPALVKGQGNSFTPAAASGVVQEVFEDSAAAGEPELSPHVLRDSSDVWQPKSPRAVTTPGSHEPYSQHGDSVLLDTRGDGGEESSCVIKQLESKDLYEGQGELHGLLDLMSENEVLPDNRNDTVTKESKSHEGIQSDTDTLNPCPADPALGNAEQLLENQQLEIQSRLSPSKEVTAPRDTLSSCTVVEGLLFPVEYYVRTTRRMSNCQRKVDLDAVILSQLGRSKKGPRNDSSRGHSCPTGSEGPAALHLPAADADTRCSLFSFRSLQWLVPRLGIRDFHLPNEEFGVLKLEKLESSPVNDLESFVPSVSGDGVAPEDTPGAQMYPEEKNLRSHLISPSKSGLPKLPPMDSPASKKEISTHELLFTPVGTVLAGAPAQPESQISSSVFPAVGATPGVLPSVHSEIFPDSPSVPASQVALPSGAAQALGDGAHKDPAMPLHPDSCGAGAARKEEEQGTTFPAAGERGPENRSDQTVALDKHQQSESKEQRSCKASPEQKKHVAEWLTPVLADGPREENLELMSELKDSSGSCAVDVGTVWWEAAGCRELCVVTASESSVSLWEPLVPNHWRKIYTWQLEEIPVIQIVPLPDTCNLVCVALGELEIGEIRVLLYSSETDSFKHSLVKTGNIKAVVGLKDQRLVSSSRTLQEQQVEMVSLSGTGGSKDRQTLMPPKETVTAFAEVEGMKEALVGTTAANSIVVWNLKTGQLLRKTHIGYSYPASICHRAYSDSGLLFVVLSHPHAKESESCGHTAFRVVAFNPRTGGSRGLVCSSLPPGCAGRYLEGDVWDTAGAAVLTSGALTVWDLLRGRCVALLPPGPSRRWALARWAGAGAGLLAGQRDGTVHLYRYRQPQPGAA